MSVFVGVDVGTTRVKAVAIDADGRVLSDAEQPTPWTHGPGGTIETDPDELVRRAVAVACEAARDTPIAGLGVTGMGETGALVDGHDRPVAPAIGWHDRRGAVGTIARELGADAFRRTTGLPLTTQPTINKLCLLGTGGARRFYSVGEWVVRRLGARPVTELSLASRTGLVELATGRPWAAAGDLVGHLLNEPVVAGTPAGTAHGEEVPAVLRGAVLTVAGHDHQVAAYATGTAVDGALFDSLGTAEAYLRTVKAPMSPDAVDALTAAGMAVGHSVVAGHLGVLAGLFSGLVLERLAGLLGATTAARRADLGTAALREPPHPTLRVVDVHNGLFGLTGVGDDVTPAVVWRAAVDAVTAHADAVLAAIETATGPARDVVVAGGWLQNPAVRAAKERQFPGLRTTTLTEPGAYGAAQMAVNATN
jgi:sugar (pentulose or hexulose) kinase